MKSIFQFRGTLVLRPHNLGHLHEAILTFQKEQRAKQKHTKLNATLPLPPPRPIVNCERRDVINRISRLVSKHRKLVVSGGDRLLSTKFTHAEFIQLKILTASYPLAAHIFQNIEEQFRIASMQTQPNQT